MPKVGTLAYVMEMGFRLHLSCGRCSHVSEALDLDALVVARGEDFPLQRLVEIGRCERCGTKGGCDLTLTPPHGPGGRE